MEHRIVHNKDKCKIQRKYKVWIFEMWADLDIDGNEVRGDYWNSTCWYSCEQDAQKVIEQLEIVNP